MTTIAPTNADIRSLAFSHSRQLVDWMKLEKISFAFTSYQTGRLFLVGVDEKNLLSMVQRQFTRAMGLYADDQSLCVADLFQLWWFNNVLEENQSYQKSFDRLYVPRLGFTTGDIDVHDIGVNKSGEPVFVNTLYSCIATVSVNASFRPIWKPPFISKLAPEDRCHLNGLAMDDGAPVFATAVSQSDSVEGWRDHKRDGGVIIDIASGEIAAAGLSMPHSPRLHDGALWVLNSGSGWLGVVDPAKGTFEPVTFCPGFLRGLSFYRHYAMVSVSLPRNIGFVGLELDQNLKDRQASPRCAVLIIDTRSGDILHWVTFESHITELYDVAFLPGVQRPMHLGFQTDEIRQLITVEGDLD